MKLLTANLLDQVYEGFYQAIQQLFNPAGRIHVYYLATSLVIALVYFFIVYKNKGNKNILHFLFPKKIWWNKSALLDCQLFFFNYVLKGILIIPYLIGGITGSILISRLLLNYAGAPPDVGMNKLVVVIGYTTVFWFVSDFSRFHLHYLAHRIPFLWEFHKVHHAAKVMNPLTLYRTHPVEMFLFKLRSVIVFSTVTGVFAYLFPVKLTAIDVLGVNVFHFFFLITGANLRHSHIWIGYGKFLEHIFISPAQHQIHHGTAPAQHHRNMGSHLAIWDWMFGTLSTSKEFSRKDVKFGLVDEQELDQGFLSNILNPFKKAFKRVAPKKINGVDYSVEGR